MTHREKSILAKITVAFFALLGIILILIFRLGHGSGPSVVACAVICLAASVYADREDRRERESQHERAAQAAEERQDEGGPPTEDR